MEAIVKHMVVGVFGLVLLPTANMLVLAREDAGPQREPGSLVGQVLLAQQLPVEEGVEEAVSPDQEQGDADVDIPAVEDAPDVAPPAAEGAPEVEQPAVEQR